MKIIFTLEIPDETLEREMKRDGQEFNKQNLLAMFKGMEAEMLQDAPEGVKATVTLEE